MDAQGGSSTSPFCQSPIHWKYDVFLSFRGEDTRKTFTGHLYARLHQVGVNTFIDDEGLRKGDVISKELEKAIEESRISIVVFSKDYASSSWCLDELVKILECKDKLKQLVLPIFYDVDPSQVRWQEGIFGEAFARQRKHFVDQRMDKWATALREAANLSGWDLRKVADGHESKFIEKIIQQVLQEVNQTPLDVACHPVGLDTRVEDVELFLKKGCEDEVQMLGIYGVGGIGKTTLAKAIYNRIFQHFDGSCFLLNVKSEAETFYGLANLQEKLLHQILKTKEFKVNSVSEGVNLIKARLGSKKVLVVIDDVDHISQLESLTRERSWFGLGSLIIVTTRDKHLLCGFNENERYEATILNDTEALQLFSSHSFHSHFPPQDYVEVTQDIIMYSGGLPLALVILGSHLRGRSIEEWRYEFQKLRAIPHYDIQKILKISFDGLDGDTQSIFLDIACFFQGIGKDEVINTLNACGFHSESAIETLVNKCLVKRYGHSLVMHDLVRDMGREIVRMESPQDPGRRSRLFSSQDVHDVLQGNKGSKKVEVLKVEPGAFKGLNLSTKVFKKMKNLRVLKIDELHISGDFELFSKEIRWLSWQKCPLKCIPSNFPANRLVVLKMGESNIQEFAVDLQCCKSLKELDLSCCKRLTRTPNFNGAQNLVTLALNGCSSLTEIHPSVGNLDKLATLYLFECKKLTGLPSSICRLKSLQELYIMGCSSIQTLPVDIGGMQNLYYLNAVGAGIKQLPRSVELLSDIEVLEMGVRKSEARSSFARRRGLHIESLSTSLRELRLTYCGLLETDIPWVIGSLSSLLDLDLSGNNFHYLPFEFSKLQCLNYLHLNDCENLQILPSVSNLEVLKTISVANCKKLVKVTELDNLPSIDWIDMANCISLRNPFNEDFFTAPALGFQSRKCQNLMTVGLRICLQCNEIPDWCSKQVAASSISFTMPTHNQEFKFLGMIVWCVRKFFNVPSSELRQGLRISFAEKMSSSLFVSYFHNNIPAGHVELSCVLYKSHLEAPFDGQIKGGEKIQVVESSDEQNTVTNIGIHLLYLDEQGKVTSLPAVVDHFESDEVWVDKYPEGVSSGQSVASGGRSGIWCNISSLIRFLSSCFTP